MLKAAQPIVTDVDGSDPNAVQKALDAVQGAMDACAAAGRREEHAQLSKAKNELVGHLDYLRKKKNSKENRKLTKEQLAELVKHGDPSCPRGQAYKHSASGKEIRCKGPQIVDLPWADAKDYWESRGFKLEIDEAKSTLTAEYGAELYVYRFAKVGSKEPATCLTLYPAPGIPWQEALARATGIQPRFLKREDETIKTGRGKVPLSIEDPDGKLVIRIGRCES